MYVIKRNGKKVAFKKQKITKAIEKAFESVDGEITEYAIKKAENIANYIEAMDKDLDIETIQDYVEKGLMSTNRKDVAKAYIIYRAARTDERNKRLKRDKIIREKLFATNVKNQNANVDEYSFGGRMGEANSEVMRNIALDDIISEKHVYNHINNRIYIHDLDQYACGSHNCLSIPFDKLLKNGFKTRQTDVRPAGSINTAFQLVAVIFQLQSLNQFGGVSATHLDWTMIPYVRKSFYKHYCDYIKIIKEKEVPDIFNVLMEIEDEKYKQYDFKAYKYALIQTKKELKQAVEGLFHNLNTLQSRSGNQLPFTSINYGTCTKPEGQMVIEALLDGSINGVGKLHKTSSFPCCIFQVMKGVNKEPNTPNYYLYRKALYSTAKRLYPNYCNVDWSGNEGYDKNDPKTFFSTMGCRTANGWDINGFKQTKDGRGNICPVTIIMPTLAMEAKIKKGDVVKNFLEILDKAISDAKDCLIERFEWICSQSPKSASFMYENGVMEGYIPEEGIRSALKHGTLAMGNIGLAETLQILIGCDHTTDRGMKLAKQIYQLFKDRCAQYKEQYKLNFGVYMTPAENLSYTAMQKFKKKYGVIKNVSENEFFTNSMHVPVWKQMNPFEKIDIESQLTGYSSAGCITYTELDSEAIQNIDAIETIVNYAMDKDIPYFAINVPNDTCDDCGYSAEIDTVCPQCGSSNIQRLRRVTGYITADYKTSFNPGKKQEVEMRVKHMKFKQRDKN